MSARIEEWLARMREARPSGSVARVTASERGRDLGWIFEIAETTDIAELAGTIDKTCTDAGVTSCELRALNAERRWIGQLLHKVDPPAQIVPVGAPLTLPAGVEDIVQHALQASRSFAGLSFKAIVKNHDIALQIIDRLERQVTNLTKENADLRQRLADRWEIADKLHTHQLDDELAKDKAMRQGRIAETLVHAALARLFGKGTPESQTIQTRMSAAFLRSLSDDQIQKIVSILTEDQRVALFELIQGATADQGAVPASNGTGPGPDSQAAAAAATVMNVKR